MNKMGWRETYRQQGAVIPDEERAREHEDDSLKAVADRFDREFTAYTGILYKLHSLSKEEFEKVLTEEDKAKLQSGEFPVSDDVREALETRLGIIVPKTDLNLDLIASHGMIPRSKPMPKKIFYFIRKSAEQEVSA